jgi:hypothetical protein
MDERVKAHENMLVFIEGLKKHLPEFVELGYTYKYGGDEEITPEQFLAGAPGKWRTAVSAYMTLGTGDQQVMDAIMGIPELITGLLLDQVAGWDDIGSLSGAYARILAKNLYLQIEERMTNKIRYVCYWNKPMEIIEEIATGYLPKYKELVMVTERLDGE